jgi:hypothetical protein
MNDTHSKKMQLSKIQEARYVLSDIRRRIAQSTTDVVPATTNEIGDHDSELASHFDGDVGNIFGVMQAPTLHSFDRKLPALAMERKKLGESSVTNAVFHLFKSELINFVKEESGKADLKCLDRNEVVRVLSLIFLAYFLN